MLRSALLLLFLKQNLWLDAAWFIGVTPGSSSMALENARASLVELGHAFDRAAAVAVERLAQGLVCGC